MLPALLFNVISGLVMDKAQDLAKEHVEDMLDNILPDDAKDELDKIESDYHKKLKKLCSIKKRPASSAPHKENEIEKKIYSIINNEISNNDNKAVAFLGKNSKLARLFYILKHGRGTFNLYCCNWIDWTLFDYSRSLWSRA